MEAIKEAIKKQDLSTIKQALSRPNAKQIINTPDA